MIVNLKIVLEVIKEIVKDYQIEEMDENDIAYQKCLVE